MKRLLFMAAGILSAALGFCGMFLPVLPTTPFLLLAAFCFSKSSPKLEYWLAQTRPYQLYVKPFKSNNGIPRKRKIYILGFSYAVIVLSAILSPRPLVWLILACIALFLLWLIVVRIPTAPKPKPSKTQA